MDLIRPQNESALSNILNKYGGKDPILLNDFENSLKAAYTLTEVKKKQLSEFKSISFDAKLISDRHFFVYYRIKTMIAYSKLNSQGNDFIFVEYGDSKPQLTIDQIKYYSQRDVIGCDQFFIINTSDINNIYCEVINQDGSRACQCGNGLRAAMLFLNKKYDTNMTNLIVCDNTYKAKIDGRFYFCWYGQSCIYR